MVLAAEICKFSKQEDQITIEVVIPSRTEEQKIRFGPAGPTNEVTFYRKAVMPRIKYTAALFEITSNPSPIIGSRTAQEAPF